jgi:hypothetical protein
MARRIRPDHEAIVPVAGDPGWDPDYGKRTMVVGER